MHLRLLRAAGAVVLLAAPLCAQLQVLNYRPAKAAYSALLDRIIMVNGNPSQLHIYHPISKADIAIALPAPPTTLALSTDGKHAVVGHTNSISYVDLSKPQPIVERTVNVSGAIQQVAVTKTGYAYVSTVYPGTLRYANLATGMLTVTNETASEYETLYLHNDEGAINVGHRKYSLVAGVIQLPGAYGQPTCFSNVVKRRSMVLASSVRMELYSTIPLCRTRNPSPKENPAK
jgi:hypothetical protein